MSLRFTSRTTSLLAYNFV